MGLLHKLKKIHQLFMWNYLSFSLIYLSFKSLCLYKGCIFEDFISPMHIHVAWFLSMICQVYVIVLNSSIHVLNFFMNIAIHHNIHSYMWILCIRTNNCLQLYLTDQIVQHLQKSWVISLYHKVQDRGINCIWFQMQTVIWYIISYCYDCLAGWTVKSSRCWSWWWNNYCCGYCR